MNKKAKYSAQDLTMLTARAKEHAEARRAKLLDEGALDLVVGGLGTSGSGGVTTGATGPDPIGKGSNTNL
jgi:hypothetical protein